MVRNNIYHALRSKKKEPARAKYLQFFSRRQGESWAREVSPWHESALGTEHTAVIKLLARGPKVSSARMACTCALLETHFNACERVPASKQALWFLVPVCEKGINKCCINRSSPYMLPVLNKEDTGSAHFSQYLQSRTFEAWGKGKTAIAEMDFVI